MPERTLVDYIYTTYKGDSIFSQFYNKMKRDSIQSFRKLKSSDRASLILNDYPYSIQIVNDKITYRSKIGKEFTYYIENVDYTWVLKDSTTNINSYKCKFAKTEYAGRVWNAWYTTDLPINVGPYKFKNLPGCIIKVYDSEHLFDFELINMKKKKEVRLKPFPYITKQNFVLKERKDFNKLFQAFKSLSFSEAVAYMNRNDPERSRGKIVAVNGDDTLTRNSTGIGYEEFWLEIDHLE